jgi:hypothetical protein
MTKVEIKLESTPSSPIPNVNKRTNLNVNEQDLQIQAIVHILGNILLTVRRDIIDKKGDLFFYNIYKTCMEYLIFFFCLHVR